MSFVVSSTSPPSLSCFSFLATRRKLPTFQFSQSLVTSYLPWPMVYCFDCRRGWWWVEGQQLHQEGAHYSQEEQDRWATSKGFIIAISTDAFLNNSLFCGMLIQRGPQGGAMGTRGEEKLTLTPLKLQLDWTIGTLLHCNVSAHTQSHIWTVNNSSCSWSRIFVATWNVGGRSPPNNMSLEDWLHAAPPADIYVLGYLIHLCVSIWILVIVITR